VSGVTTTSILVFDIAVCVCVGPRVESCLCLAARQTRGLVAGPTTVVMVSVRV
jgi:hypothetical protein